MTCVFLGNGDAGFIAEFSRRHNLGDKHVTILTDPTLNVYQLAGLERSVWSILEPQALVGAVRALGRGHTQSGRAGDDTQQGGLLLMDSEGVVRFCYRNKHLTDHADANEVVQVAMTLAAGSIAPAQGRV